MIAMTTKKYPIRTIEKDSGVLPDVVAERVVEIANHLLGSEFDEREIGYYAGYLVTTAEQVYQSSEQFRKKLRSEARGGNAGRDHLYAFMQHWLSSKLLKDSGNRPEWRKKLVDSGFSMGKWLG